MAERVALINLGCPKNLVDAEVMLGHLRARGYELTADPERADVVVVNTCGFLQDAAQESVDTLLRAARRKRDGSLRAVVAAGCMAQRYGEDAAEAMPEVDGFLGVGQAQELPDVVARVLQGERVSLLRGPSAGFEGYGLRLPSGPATTAYVKVSEGCDRRCSFCVIPGIRGPMVSRHPQDVLAEARLLAAQGARELILIGQDPNRYGVDLDGPEGGRFLLPELLEELSALPELRWIRLMYLFPDRNAPAVLEAVARLPRLCRYVDMPLQHASAAVLRRMNRPGSGEEYQRVLAAARERCPDLTVRSTFIVGFPGETEAEFGDLLRFVREAELDWVGAFRFSPEEGAPAAELPDRVPPAEIRRRHHTLLSAARQLSERRLRRWHGRRLEVLVESVEPDRPRGRGRTAGQAPEIDGETVLDLRRLPDTRPGDFVLAEVTGSRGYDLKAAALELLHRPPRHQPGLLHLGLLPAAPPTAVP